MLARGMAAYAAMQLGRRIGAAIAITIRNRETERMIREIGKHYGERPSQTIRRLAEKELDQPGAALQEEFDRACGPGTN